MARKTFYVQHLHVLNLPFVVLLKLFGTVYIFKYKGFCQRLIHSKFLPSVPDFKDVDHWRQARESAFQMLKRKFSTLRPERANEHIQGLQLETETLFLQTFFRDYEQYIFLFYLSQLRSLRPTLLGSSYLSYLSKYQPQLLQEHLILKFPFAFLDGLYELLQSQLTFFKMLVKFFYRQSENFDFKQFKYIFTGISPVEYPTSTSTLNFAWPVLNGVVAPEQSLFVLDMEPSEKSKDFLNSKGIQFVTRSKLINSLPLREKLPIAVDCFLKNFCLHDFYKKNFVFLCYLQNRLWHTLFKKINPSFFIFSFSSGWPELSEVSVANALGIQTIQWFYGTSEFGYTRQRLPFQDDSVRFCLRVAKEFWVWNPLLKKLIEKRSFLPSQSRIEVVGPLLNGIWPSSPSPQPKPALFRIAFFDITPMKARMRLQYGEGPYCNSEMQNRIYQSVLKIQQSFPDVQIAIKTKRVNNPLIFETQPALQYLLDAKLERIEFLSPNSDPYLAVQNADLVISTPYTSPSILALHLGKKGIFYDPTKTACHTYQEAFQKLTFYSEEDLFAFIAQAKAESENITERFRSEDFPVIDSEQMKKNLRARLL